MLENDQITIIEGEAGCHWWRGQNQRTLLLGKLPRAVLDPQRQLAAEDISLPLRNSFVHTGHMGAQGGDKNWGSAATIDEIFLSNPMDPPDLVDDSNIGYYDSKRRDRPIEIVSSLMSDQNLINLMEGNANDARC